MSTYTLRKTFVLFSIFLISLMWTSIALASSYTTHFTFAHQLTSITRYFDGQNIALEATAITYPDPKYPNATEKESIYKVTLKRINYGQPEERIGSVTLSRNGYGKAVWTNVGLGNYYFFFEKYKDRMIVDANYVKLYNY